MTADALEVPLTESLRLRRRVMEALYALFREYPYAPIELGHLQDACGVGAKTLNWNMVYLEKCGYLELDKSGDCPPFVACTASLTAAGIDLVEDAAAFQRRFRPPEPPEAA